MFLKADVCGQGDTCDVALAAGHRFKVDDNGITAREVGIVVVILFAGRYLGEGVAGTDGVARSGFSLEVNRQFAHVLLKGHVNSCRVVSVGVAEMQGTLSAIVNGDVPG